MKKLNWVSAWFWFFAVNTSAFAVLLMLKLTKTIVISWGWVFVPFVIEVFFPMVVVLAGIAIEFWNEEKGDRF